MMTEVQVERSLKALKVAYDLGVEDTFKKVTDILSDNVCEQCKDTPMGADWQLACRETLTLIAYLKERMTA